jgi:hypothetical protein
MSFSGPPPAEDKGPRSGPEGNIALALGHSESPRTPVRCRFRRRPRRRHGSAYLTWRLGFKAFRVKSVRQLACSPNRFAISSPDAFRWTPVLNAGYHLGLVDDSLDRVHAGSTFLIGALRGN